MTPNLTDLQNLPRAMAQRHMRALADAKVAVAGGALTVEEKQNAADLLAAVMALLAGDGVAAHLTIFVIEAHLSGIRVARASQAAPRAVAMS